MAMRCHHETYGEGPFTIDVLAVYLEPSWDEQGGNLIKNLKPTNTGILKLQKYHRGVHY
jgi:hypothetical protein